MGVHDSFCIYLWIAWYSGVVRKTSSRIIPDVNSGNGQFTINRPAAPIPEEGSKHPRLDRFKNRKNT